MCGVDYRCNLLLIPHIGKMASLTLSIFQAAARAETPDARLSWLDMAAERAAHSGADILVCPELTVSGYSTDPSLPNLACPANGDYGERVGEIAFLHEIAIVFGYPEQAQDGLYNSVCFVSATGEIVANHRKNHPAPGPERALFQAGAHGTVFEYGGWTIALLAGGDIDYPEAARRAALAGAEVLIIPAALAADAAFVAHHLVPTRAFENGLYLAFANWAGQHEGRSYLGESAIIGPEGAIEASAGPATTILLATLDKARIADARNSAPYLVDCQKRLQNQ